MRQTVVGAFNEYAAAQRAAEYLASQGIERDHIHVEAPGAASGSAPHAAAGEHEDKGVIANVRSFFAEVFGPESEHQMRQQAGSSEYGAARVVVDIDEDWQVTEVCSKLRSAGALELHQHAREWRTTGWSGFDEGVSTAYAADRVPVAPNDAIATGSRTNATPLAESRRSDDAHLPSYREHWTQNYAALGGRYEEYDAAYRYGQGLAGESRHQGQDWASLEATARREWDERQGEGGSAWERIKGAVKHAWERARH